MGWADAFTAAFSGFLEYTLGELRDPSLASPHVIILTVAAACLFVELLAPAKQPWPVFRRPGFLQDLAYVVWMDFVVFPAGLYAFLVAGEGVATGLLERIGLPPHPYLPLDGLPPLAVVVIAFVLTDFFEWAAHYALHRVPLLWRFHRIHHAQTTLGFASTRHFHVGEHLVFRAALFVPLLLIGVPAVGVLIVAWVHTSLAFLSHSNVRLDLGRLNRWILTPDNHFQHHAKATPRPYGVNFGSNLMVWDHLFGTFHLPDVEPELGLPDDDTPAGFFAQQLHPFLPRGGPGPHNHVPAEPEA